MKLIHSQVLVNGKVFVSFIKLSYSNVRVRSTDTVLFHFENIEPLFKDRNNIFSTWEIYPIKVMCSKKYNTGPQKAKILSNTVNTVHTMLNI